jgi:hypothetical protein
MVEKRALIALALVLVGTNVATAYYFTIYEPRIPVDKVPISVEELLNNYDKYKGKVVVVTGYLVMGPTGPLLAGHPFDLLNNTMERTNLLEFMGDSLPDIDPLGRCSDVECEVDPDCDPLKGTVKITYISHVIRDDLRVPGVFEDRVLDTSILEGLNLTQVQPIAQKYAVLYSGGWNETKAYYRYWNDIVYMYYILTLFGYPEENIYVIYKDGVGHNTTYPVHYPATQASMETVFQELNQTMTTRDSLFFYTTNHGGSPGISTYWPNGGDEFLNTTEVAGWLDSISCHHMIIFMQQCFSYNFIPALSAPNRVIMTSCSIGESAYGCDTEGQWDEFSYHLMSALIGYRLNGDGPAFADFINADGKISMREAYLYAVLNNSWSVNFLYDDDGDGVGLWGGPVFFGSGFYGDNVFL